MRPRDGVEVLLELQTRQDFNYYIAAAPRVRISSDLKDQLALNKHKETVASRVSGTAGSKSFSQSIGLLYILL